MKETKLAVIRAGILAGCGYFIAEGVDHECSQWLYLVATVGLFITVLWQHGVAVDDERRREQLYDMVRPPHEKERGKST